MNELVVANNPSSLISESINNIRTNLLFSVIDKPLKSILITSSIPSEGKSFTSSNLALSFSQVNRKVLIIDCDMRKGRLHEIFNVSNKAGLSALLLEDISGTKKELEKVYSKFVLKTDYENLDIITSGYYPPNPSDMISSNKFGKVIDDLSNMYDTVIIDGVPLEYLSDSIGIAKHVDKVVIVSALNETPKELLAESVKKLNIFKDKIAGVVINKVEYKADHYSYRKEM